MTTKRNSILITNPSDKFDEIIFDQINTNPEIIHLLSYFKIENTDKELEFKKLLEKNKIPYLYLGQGPFKIEQICPSLNKTKSKKSDFLVNLKNLGEVIFDLRSAEKIKFSMSRNSYFSVTVSEFEELSKTQKLILAPIWLVYTNKNKICPKNSTLFYFISLSLLAQFWKGLSQRLNENDFKKIKILRIPDELLIKVKSKIALNELNKIEENTFDVFSKKNIDHYNKIKKR
ncbi:hypothetical protein [Flavobacterium humidisoli]|uniref:Uncharacterized protein n=1 Tax=Flavobacterium humidisoli TaxID=2937442 RepID=A0ABY4LXY5_9FLAO|nr:hypothetical protein [Flavobacterium humidisoli]UPZ17910.1 hypothetical protein M0M44_11290 [Flavobacterium humidisoli]